MRGLPDSDGNSVVDVYLSPRDPEASSDVKNGDESARHLQFLESMVPAEVLGYQFICKANSADGGCVAGGCAGDHYARHLIKPAARPRRLPEPAPFDWGFGVAFPAVFMVFNEKTG